MSRKRTGLRNKYRSGGRSTYSVQRKTRNADRYGKYRGRICDTPDSIAGHALNATRDIASTVTK